MELLKKNQFFAVSLQAVLSVKWSLDHPKITDFSTQNKNHRKPLFYSVVISSTVDELVGPSAIPGVVVTPSPGFPAFAYPLFLTYVRRYRHRIHRLCLFARHKNTKKVLLLATRLYESEN